MNKFRLLNADEIECRISSVNEKGLSLLLYKTARTDANILDETVGPENWANDFKVVDGVLYGEISIYDPQLDRWVSKWDAGTESNTEAEKGRASDAFKRAGFKWGIGRELYTAPFIWITPDKCSIEDRKGRKACFDTFRVVEIGYDEKNEINKLIIANEKRGIDVFVYPKKRNVIKYGESKNTDVPLAPSEAQAPQGAPDGQFYCDECGELIKGLRSNGKSYSPAEVANRGLTKHNKQLCWICQKKLESRRDAEPADYYNETLNG